MSIANVGTTLRHPDDYDRPRTRRAVRNGIQVTEVYSKKVMRPRIIELVFRQFEAIDRHDAYRQGQLSMERTCGTRTWWHRLFATILGVIFTDCYFAYDYHERQRYNALAMSFLRLFCYESDFRGRTVRNVRQRVEVEEPKRLHVGLGRLGQLPYYVLCTPESRPTETCAPALPCVPAVHFSLLSLLLHEYRRFDQH